MLETHSTSISIVLWMRFNSNCSGDTITTYIYSTLRLKRLVLWNYNKEARVVLDIRNEVKSPSVWPNYSFNWIWISDLMYSVRTVFHWVDTWPEWALTWSHLYNLVLSLPSTEPVHCLGRCALVQRYIWEIVTGVCLDVCHNAPL